MYQLIKPLISKLIIKLTTNTKIIKEYGAFIYLEEITIKIIFMKSIK